MNKEIAVDYMPTAVVIADVLTKPLQGTLFKRLNEKFLTVFITVQLHLINHVDILNYLNFFLKKS